MKKNFTPKLLTTILSLFLINSSQAGIMDIFKRDYKPIISPALKDLPYQKWQDTESGIFAHSLKYEDKLAQPVPYIFTKGKDREQEGKDYFEHLCATEGKDYIYKIVENVDTVAQLRSFEIPVNDIVFELGALAYSTHPYALEAPMFFNSLYAGQMVYKEKENRSIGYVSFDGMRGFYGIPYINYQIKLNNNEIYNFKMDYIKRELLDNTSNRTDFMSVEKLDKITARYGFTWRGFSRPQDREYGVAGGDLIIIDLEKNEIIGIQRTFIKAHLNKNSSSHINWEGVGCFEQYKNSIAYNDINLTGKSFNEKAKIINNSPVQTNLMPKFLRKVLKNPDYK